jgi:hypothetical protein
MASTPSFSSPWAHNLPEIYRVLYNMDTYYQITCLHLSSSSTTTVCNKSYLHIYETDSDIASLLQLTQVIMKLLELKTYIPQSNGMPKSTSAGMVILVEVKPGQDDFARVCELVKHLTDSPGREHLNGGVVSFGGIKVVSGMDNSHTPSSNGDYRTKDHDDEARKVVDRVNKSIERIFSTGAYAEKKIVWHHGPVVHFLNFWINNTTHELRSSLTAMTVHSLLSISESGIAPSAAGKTNNISDLSRLQDFCERLNIFVVFLDTSSQLLTHPHLSTYLYFHAFYINTFLPPSVTRAHYHKALDELTTFAFRLRGACEGAYGTAVVKEVQAHLDPRKAKAWARECIKEENFDKAKCRAAAKDEIIDHAVRLADSPFATFEKGNAALSRLTLGPAASLIAEHYICAPVSISFSNCQIRFHNPSPFQIYLPERRNQDRITQRIQGVMIGVLQMVGMKKGPPVIGKEEKARWDDAAKACTWALEGCNGKLPDGVEEKVKFVEEMLKYGTWSWALFGTGTQQQVGWK